MNADKTKCTACDGEGLIHTGIEEAPTTMCERCGGSGKTLAERVTQPAQDRCCEHDSDCAIHNAPAYPVGPCDCTLSEKPAKEQVAAAMAVPDELPSIRLGEFAHGAVTLNQVMNDIEAWSNARCAMAREEALKSIPAGHHPDCTELRRQDHEQACRITHALQAERDGYRQRAEDAEAKLASIQSQAAGG